MNYKTKHNRTMHYGAKYSADAEYERLRSTPTSKQVKFFKKLCVLCKKSNIEIPIKRGETRTRIEMGIAIDKLIQLLNENGVDVHGNGKTAVGIIRHGIYGNGYRTTQRIVVQDEEGDKKWKI